MGFAWYQENCNDDGDDDDKDEDEWLVNDSKKYTYYIIFLY